MTAAVVWPFSFVRPYNELRVTDEDVVQLGHGVTLRRDNLPDPGYMLRIDAEIRLGPTETLKTWQAWIATYGTTTGFLVQAAQLVARSSTDYNMNREVVAEDVGTGDGTTAAFALDMRHIDESSLVVKVDGITKTLTTHYTVSGNDSAPTITFTGGNIPASMEAITADYGYYWPMVLDGWTASKHENGRILRVTVTLNEEQAGLHLA